MELKKRKWGLILVALDLLLFIAIGYSLIIRQSPHPTPTLPVQPIQPTKMPSYPTASLVPTAIPATAFPTLPVLPVRPTIKPASPTSSIVPSAIPPTAFPVTSSVTIAPPPNFCLDRQATALIISFKSALQSTNGSLLASLVSPVHGMDVRLYREGRVVNYDQAHSKFLFTSTFQEDWGRAPASGVDIKGSFQQLIVPELLEVFDLNYTLSCNQIQVGGTSYKAIWPYRDINFYSLYFEGSQGTGSMDWNTLLLGMHYVNAKPYLYAIMKFRWEP